MALDVSQLTRPGVDPAIARNTQRTQDLMLAQMAGSTPAGQPPPKSTDVAQAAAGTTSAVGQQVLKQAAGEVAALKGQAGNVMAGQAATAQAQLGQAKLTRQQQATQNEAQLAGLDASSKKKLLDDRIQFQTDVTGQTQLQTTQLLDWAVEKSKNQQQLADYTQKTQEAVKKAEATAKAGYDAMTATLEAASKGQIQGMSEATKLQVAQAQALFHKQYLESAAKASSMVGTYGAIGTIAGAIVGGVLGSDSGNTATGAVIGGMVGGGIGTALGSATQ